MIGDKSTLRRLEIQIPKDDQPAFLASIFDVDILREAIALKERGLTKRAVDKSRAGSSPQELPSN